MLALLFSILCSTSIYILFKLAGKHGAKNQHIIVINYLVATLLGFFLHEGENEELLHPDPQWLGLAILIGVSFVVMFHLIAYASQKAGVSVTSLATRLSVVLPIAFSIYIDPDDFLSLSKVLIILFTLLALFLSVYKKRNGQTSMFSLFLPLVLFIGAGTLDSFVKYGQQHFVGPENLAAFSTYLFLFSFVTALLFSLLNFKEFRSAWPSATWIFGVLLGVMNFGTIYFIVLALESGFADSSVLFAANNISIVVLSVAVALVFFREKLSRLNIIGVLMSIVALILLFTFL